MKPLLSASAARHRLNAILPFLHGDVLDLGCGWLSLPDRLTGKQRYIGIDVSPAAVKYNAQRYPAHSYHQRDLDREPLALGDHRFDVVTMIALLEHLRAPEYVLHQIHSVLTPDGLL
jgi:2-polyprenyl-3-methyl-5-hydroxy-6-metoxy-1,4-benzoquinol methylase